MNAKGLFCGLSVTFISEICIIAAHDNLTEFAAGIGVGVFIFMVTYYLGSL